MALALPDPICPGSGVGPVKPVPGVSVVPPPPPAETFRLAPRDVLPEPLVRFVKAICPEYWPTPRNGATFGSWPTTTCAEAPGAREPEEGARVSQATEA